MGARCTIKYVMRHRLSLYYLLFDECPSSNCQDVQMARDVCNWHEECVQHPSTSTEGKSNVPRQKARMFKKKNLDWHKSDHMEAKWIVQLG
jgi:hypothetical protein